MKFQGLRDFITALGGRRFVLTVGAGAVNSFLRWHDKIDVSAYTTLIMGTVGVYIVGNVAQKWKETNARKTGG